MINQGQQPRMSAEADMMMRILGLMTNPEAHKKRLEELLESKLASEAAAADMQEKQASFGDLERRSAELDARKDELDALAEEIGEREDRNDAREQVLEEREAEAAAALKAAQITDTKARMAQNKVEKARRKMAEEIAKAGV